MTSTCESPKSFRCFVGVEGPMAALQARKPSLGEAEMTGYPGDAGAWRSRLREQRLVATTLASIETDATGSELQQGEGDTEAQSDPQVGNPPTQLRSLRVDTSVNSGHLSTIAEGISPARQSSTAPISPRSGDVVSERSVSHNWDDGGAQSGGEQRHGSREHEATQLGNSPLQKGRSRPSGSFWAGASERSLRNKIRRHLSKPRNFTIHRLGLRIEMSPTPAAPAPPPSFAPNTEQRGGRHGKLDHLPNNMLGTDSDTTAILDHLSVYERNLPTAEPMESVQQPESGHPDRLIDRAPTQHDKQERIRARRREATLKRKAEMIARCECRSECQCRNGSFRSNAASYGPEGSERSIQIPDHHLHRLLSESTEDSTSRSSSSMVRSLDLHGIGSHVRFDHENPPADDPTNTAIENQQFFDDRLSQASTAYVRSNGSSISLLSRRPSSLRRSNTAPGFPTRRPVDGLRPHVIEALQNCNIPGQAYGSASQAPESSGSSDSDVGAIPSTAPAASAEAPGDSPIRESEPPSPPPRDV
ncbi:MAG: hypothetical protein Q9170_006326 [Blastenia crenularia]